MALHYMGKGINAQKPRYFGSRHDAVKEEANSKARKVDE